MDFYATKTDTGQIRLTVENKREETVLCGNPVWLMCLAAIRFIPDRFKIGKIPK